MPKVFTSKNQRTGEIGEHVAARYFASKGFEIIERNYTKRCGEIDIIARKRNKTHFIEVKSIKVFDAQLRTENSGYRPEENMHFAKQQKLRRTIQTYLGEIGLKGEWQFDLAVVYIGDELKEARVKILENIIL